MARTEGVADGRYIVIWGKVVPRGCGLGLMGGWCWVRRGRGGGFSLGILMEGGKRRLSRSWLYG